MSANEHRNFVVILNIGACKAGACLSRLLAFVLTCGMTWAQTPSTQTPAAQTPSTQTPATQTPSNQASTSLVQPSSGPSAKAGESEQNSVVMTDAADLLPELPASPRGKATLIGGRLTKLDRVRDEITMQPFGGRNLKVLFDGRTQIYRDGKKVPPSELRGGEKIYVDMVLEGATIFAKNIRILTQRSNGLSRGQIVSYDPGKGELVVNDALSPDPVRLHVSSQTKIEREMQPGSVADLRPRSLIDVKFQPVGEGQVVASEIVILAQPGKDFTFAGRVRNLDLHTGLLVLVDPRDRQTYELHFDPSSVQIEGNLVEGSEVTVTAGFDGTRYATNAIKVTSNSPR